jgi:hypothetical protein
MGALSVRRAKPSPTAEWRARSRRERSNVITKSARARRTSVLRAAGERARRYPPHVESQTRDARALGLRAQAVRALGRTQVTSMWNAPSNSARSSRARRCSPMRMILAVSAVLSLVVFFTGTGCTRACCSRDDCGSDQVCVYQIGSCSAQGECQDIPKPRCGFVSELCDCSGSIVTTGCGYPDGYATGPTTGSQSCIPGPKEPQPGFTTPDASEDAHEAESDDSADP